MCATYDLLSEKIMVGSFCLTKESVMRTKKRYGSAQNDRINIRKTVMVNISAILIVNDRSIGRSQYVKPRKEKLQLCQLSCER